MFVDVVCTVLNVLFYVPVVQNVVVSERMKVIGERNSVGGE
jgi:hypothetical protein